MISPDELEERCRKAGIHVTLAKMVKMRDAAKILGVHIATLQRYCANGNAPKHRRLNGHNWFFLAALADYLNDGPSKT